MEGDYDGALSLYARAGLEDWPLAGAPPYRLRMAAEAYATQGEAARAPAGRAPALLPGASEPSWASSPAAPGEAAGVAPPQALGLSRPGDVAFPQNSSVGFAGEIYFSQVSR